MKIKTGFLNRRWLLLILLLLIVAGSGLTGLFLSLPVENPANDRQLLWTGNIIGALQRIADFFFDGFWFSKEKKMYNKLTPEEERIIVHKGTEPPFSGKYNKHFEKGAYTCRRCGAELFESSSKFKSDCGWPSFDDQIGQSVKRLPDPDGVRTEILCAKCDAHLGHVFGGEKYTPKNTRYCVNSISMDFVPPQKQKTQKAIFASGCFWGTEYHFKQAPGVISTTVGYTGGNVDNPTYKQVCTDRTGHAEAVEVVFDPAKTNFEKLAKLFFETHDFTQLNRQGPDVGTQYRSAIFYLNERQQQVAARLVQELKKKGFDVKTQIVPAAKFWPAELYHQDYYKKTGKTPYCHVYRKIF
jgi:peptide methionine sulfoxide reductase msrA/msrB